MPPVPRSCTAIMRSTSRGPRSTRTRPTATVARMSPAATRRASVTTERPAGRRLPRPRGSRRRTSGRRARARGRVWSSSGSKPVSSVPGMRLGDTQKSCGGKPGGSSSAAPRPCRARDRGVALNARLATSSPDPSDTRRKSDQEGERSEAFSRAPTGGARTRSPRPPPLQTATPTGRSEGLRPATASQSTEKPKARPASGYQGAASRRQTQRQPQTRRPRCHQQTQRRRRGRP